MKKPHHTTDWQAERAQLVHDICGDIAARRDKREKLSDCIRLYVRRFNGNPYRCDASRRLALSKTTLTRAYYQWRRGGEVAAAVRLNYARANRPKVSAPALRSFVAICFQPGINSGKQAFARLGRRRLETFTRLHRPPLAGVTYSTLLRYLPPGVFKQIRSARRALADAELKLARLRLQVEAHAVGTLPPAKPRQHRSSLNFEI